MLRDVSLIVIVLVLFLLLDLGPKLVLEGDVRCKVDKDERDDAARDIDVGKKHLIYGLKELCELRRQPPLYLGSEPDRCLPQPETSRHYRLRDICVLRDKICHADYC